MRRLTPLVAAVAATLVAVGCWSDPSGPGMAIAAAASPDTAGSGRYMFAFRVDDVSGSMAVTANGFPVWRQGVMARTAQNDVNLPLTSALVSGRNTAAVEVVPFRPAPPVPDAEPGPAEFVAVQRIQGRQRGFTYPDDAR